MKGDPRSRGLWEASAPVAPATGPLSGELDVDVAVIGAGYTGLSAALHLAEQGASVGVLEAAQIGFGGSGRNVGLVNAGMWVMPDTLSAALGERHGGRTLRELGAGPALVYDIIARYDIACEAVRRGTLHCAVGRRGLREIAQRAAQWQRLGASVQVLSAAETAERVGTRAYTGALLDFRAGTVQPLAYARGLAGAALSRGAHIHTDTPLVGARDAGSRWELVTGGGARVNARRVIVATNAYSDVAAPWGALRAELVALPYFNLATAPLDDSVRRAILPGGEGAWNTRKILSSLRLDAAGRLVFGSVGALRGPGLAVHRAWARRELGRLFPALRGVDFEHAWYGTIGMTSNALPRLHRLARDVYAFNGYNGRGIATGTVFGRWLARLALGEVGEDDLPLPVTPLAPVSCRRVREVFYEHGAQLVHAAEARLPAAR